MMKQRYFILIIFLCFCFTGFLEAQTAQAFRELTIDEVVRIAMENNLGLQQNAIDLGGKKRASARSWNSLIPQVSAGAVASRPARITGSLTEVQDSWTTGLQLSASLNLSIVTINNIKKAKADYETGVINYEQARQELEIQVRKLFYQIILLNANKELAALSLENAQSRYAQSASLARVGQAAYLDELSARVDMENKRPALRNAEMAYENAVDSFKTLLGISVEQSISLDGSLDIADNISSISGGNLNAQGDSLEVSAILKSIETLEIQRSAAWNGAYTPSLRLSWNSMPLYVNDEWRDNSGSLSVTLSINLDNFLPWSSTKTQIDSINDNISLAQIRLKESLRNRENKITQLVRTIEKTGETIEILKLNVELAGTTYDQYVVAYRNGAIDYQRLRDTADSLLQAQNQVRQEQYNHISSILDLEKELNIPYGTLR
jgi:outer membrane protein TolC